MFRTTTTIFFNFNSNRNNHFKQQASDTYKCGVSSRPTSFRPLSRPLADGQIKYVGLIRRYRYTDLHNVKQKDPYQNDADRNTEQHYGDTQHCHCSLLVTLRSSMAARMSCILGGSIVRAWAKNLNFNQVCRSRP